MKIFGNEVRFLASCDSPHGTIITPRDRELNKWTMRQRGTQDFVIDNFVKDRCVLLLDEDRNVLLKTKF
mgnify:CR=1 FL=1